ncbi:UbiD family decarboxylase [Fibrobacter sp. UWB12]|uniref:UbiD family decarboxylase n=1 Tax=Fibrobacter sp. UWB12 TaxID=1896203 RepID=UPI0009221BFB|nr:UbiD family decarboxylase [Fibrobacter sp. UWB12]SHK43475.1 4-hydroxy-3-polyprenylbenzoate decarboxylase [Fibrobacter sp. UWB12]
MYKTLEQALLDLEKAGMLKRIHAEVDPHLEMAEIARENFRQGGPALLFEHVKGSKFRVACNIFGSDERFNFLFRNGFEQTKAAVNFKANPVDFFKNALKHPGSLFKAGFAGINSLPKRSGSIKDFEECSLSDLPQLVSWPLDGGAFITLPQVATRPSENASIMQTNVGMYRIQISGNEYIPNEECGLHYQIKRDIARHHQKAIEEGRPLKVSIFIGGPPSHTFAAVMPMPENLSELLFAGMLGNRRFRYFELDGYLVSSDADFCILGELEPGLKPEGPFGDHIGYYSGKHDFPCMRVKKVLCKKNAIFPFTVVGRPPQEDTLFGKFIHEITKPMVPASLPGVYGIHAVDDAGVHPLCLALGSEAFRPYASPEEREPMELLKTANALLGFNQASLTKYLLIAAKEDDTRLDVNNVPAFFGHVLERVHFDRDLHFQTATTIDTLDYTGTSLNHGSKIVIAAAGAKCRELRNNPSDLQTLALPQGFKNATIVMPGVLIIEGPVFNETPATLDKAENFRELKATLAHWEFRENYPWISIVDEGAINANNTASTNNILSDFLWLTFTRSDPAQDIYGLDEVVENKHWKCKAPLIVDARIKPQHQKQLEISAEITARAKQILKDAGV